MSTYIVHVKVDNTCVLSYNINMGGIKVDSLNSLARNKWKLCAFTDISGFQQATFLVYVILLMVSLKAVFRSYRMETKFCIFSENMCYIWYLVSSANPVLDRHTNYSSKRTTISITASIITTTSAVQHTSADSLQKQQLYTKSINIILAFWQNKTQKQYATYLREYISYCSQRQIDRVQVSIHQILDFLTELYDAGLEYSAINTARSAL